MCVENQKGWIFGSNNRARWCKNRKGKDAGGYRVASAKKYEKCVEVFGASKLLQIVCERLCQSSKALT